jgi:hypothetical protein
MTDAKSNALEHQILRLIFHGSSLATLFENDQSTPTTYLSVQLHTASPTDTGDMTAAEATYGAYARVGIDRSSSGWTITGSTTATATVSPATNVTFPQATSGTNTITHFSIGISTVAGNTGQILYWGTVTPNISVSAGVTPRLTTATAITEN